MGMDIFYEENVFIIILQLCRVYELNTDIA